MLLNNIHFLISAGVSSLQCQHVTLYVKICSEYIKKAVLLIQSCPYRYSTFYKITLQEKTKPEIENN